MTDPSPGLRVLPMFPLQTVLLPTAVLPLQIFEPRYRAMIRQVLDDDRCFGVALIARGHEVGGGDERTDIGTLAQVVGAQELPDGRWYVVALGTRRFRVRRWLPDDPFPIAEIEDWDDDPAAEPATSESYAALLAATRRLLALAAEAGEPAGEATMDFADDPGLGTFQVAASLPLGPFDRQNVLRRQQRATLRGVDGALCGTHGRPPGADQLPIRPRRRSAALIRPGQRLVGGRSSATDRRCGGPPSRGSAAGVRALFLAGRVEHRLAMPRRGGDAAWPPATRARPS
ncbi:MAG: LON peptidase substrate-binding domain-containing protein [Acidimicrobiales bacterium]